MTPEPTDDEISAHDTIRSVGPLSDTADAEKTRAQGVMFAQRLEKLAKHLRKYPTKQQITCYRIYEKDISEIPLIVDRYDDHLHITEYATSYARTPDQHHRWLQTMVQAASGSLDIDLAKTFLKTRNRQSGKTQHEQVADQHHEFFVSEGGLKFIVNLSDYIDTGLFLDHRITRSMFREAAREKSCLNLFSYTGAFSIYAVAGGASSMVTVDWSNTYLNWAKRNFEINGYDTGAFDFVRDSAVDFVLNHPRTPTYDLAIVDPPTFSNSKRTESLWDIQRDAVPLLQHLSLLMNPGGVVFFSNNFRQFKWDRTALPYAHVHEISNQTVPPNYRNRKIHRCWRLVV